MARASCRPRRVLAAPIWAAFFLAGGAAVDAGDITVFVSEASPSQSWGRGYGATLSTSWFQVLSLEAEAARQPGDPNALDSGMTSFTGSALLAPPVGALTPYGGVGVGLFRQTRGDASDTGRLRALILGAKLKIGGLVVVKAEYRRFNLSGTPLLPLDRRLSVGAGIAF